MKREDTVESSYGLTLDLHTLSSCFERVKDETVNFFRVVF